MATRNVVLSQHQHELVESLVRSGRYQNASAEGWSDLASGRFDDVDEDSLDDFISQLGVRAAETQSAG